MNDEFLAYYEKELDFIRQMGAEFAKVHPAQAAQLQLEANVCADPHVERLLEGFAFLTARIRKKIDDEYPEITDALLSVIYPHYQRPIPSMAMVEFVPSADPTKMTGGHLIRRGIEMTSPAVVPGGTRCRFRSAYPVTLWPIEVASASMVPDRVTVEGKPAGSVALLTLALRCTSPESWASLENFDSLRFHLHGGEPIATSLYECLFNDLLEIQVRGRIAGGEPRTFILARDPVEGTDPVEPVGFLTEESVLEYPNRSFPGYRLLQEYFAFPEKFLFFQLRGLSRLRTEKFIGPVEVHFFLKRAPRIEVTVRAENFRLGCTPVVNLFELSASPFILNRLKTSYTIVPKHGDLNANEVYSVDKVVGSGGQQDRTVEYKPFYSMRHASAVASTNDAYWFASRRPSLRSREGDEGIEVELSFVDPAFSPTVPSAEKITTHLTCTNRDLPAKLPFGGDKADFELQADAPVGRVRLLSKPTRSYRPPIGRSAQWAAIAHLGLNHLSLIDSPNGPEALREILTIYDFARTAVTTNKIQGIIGVASRQVAGRTGNRRANTVSLGMEVTIRFDEQVSGPGTFLTASILERFLGAYVTINSFTKMVAESRQREGTWKSWPPRCGDRTLL